MENQKSTINKALKDVVVVFNAEINLGKFCDKKKLPVILLTRF